jgi:hypothetical protein
MHLGFQMQHVARSIFHVVPHQWLNLYVKGEHSSLLLCWKVHSDLHLCCSREEEKTQGAPITHWSITLARKEGARAVMSWLDIMEHLLRMGPHVLTTTYPAPPAQNSNVPVESKVVGPGFVPPVRGPLYLWVVSPVILPPRAGCPPLYPHCQSGSECSAGRFHLEMIQLLNF